MLKHWYSFVFLLFISCSTPHQESIKMPTSLETSIQHPSFSADSAYAYIEKQCSFGPRVPNTPAQLACATYLKNKLSELGAETQTQNYTAKAYDGTELKGINIIGKIHPEISKRIVLFSHWDSRPFCDNDVKENWHTPVMGANDGASGVGVILEIVRQLQIRKDSIGLDVVFLDLEDYGQPSFSTMNEKDTWCLGSQYLASHPYYQVKPQKGILLDMVGGYNPYFGFDQVSQYFAPADLQKVWSIAKTLGFSSAFVPKESGSIVDDHYYINSVARIPTIDIIDFNQSRGFPDTWHTVNDTPQNINKQTLQMVGEVMMYLLTNE